MFSLKYDLSFFIIAKSVNEVGIPISNKLYNDLPMLFYLVQSIIPSRCLKVLYPVDSQEQLMLQKQNQILNVHTQRLYYFNYITIFKTHGSSVYNRSNLR